VDDSADILLSNNPMSIDDLMEGFADRAVIDETINYGEADQYAVGECDCCGAKAVELARVWYGGILETWACQRCRDYVP
jgi:hypothetical protein